MQDQFTFIHDAILESVTCGDTQIAATNLRMNISKMKKKDNQNQPNGFQYQYKVYSYVQGVDLGCLVLDFYVDFSALDLGAGFPQP